MSRDGKILEVIKLKKAVISKNPRKIFENFPTHVDRLRDPGNAYLWVSFIVSIEFTGCAFDDA